MASSPPYYGAYPSDYYLDTSEYIEPRGYNITPPQYQLPSILNSDTSIVPNFNPNSNSNMLNYLYTPSDFDASQYPFSPQPQNSAPRTPSTLSGYSTTPPDSGSLMSHQLVPDAHLPDLQQLADAIVNRRRSLGPEPVPDLYVAQFFSIESVSSSTRPATNRRKRGEKPRPENVLAYHCLWCGCWIGYSKEKAKQHFLVDFDMKDFACVEPGCTRKTARPYDFTRHMELVHKKVQTKKNRGGAMRAGKSFTELQEAYRNGERAFPVDAGQNPSHVSATTNGLTLSSHTQTTTSHLGWIGASSQSSDSTGLDQVCLLPHTRYNWLRWRQHIWVTPVFAVPGTDCYSVCIRKLAEALNSNSITKSKQIELFPWSSSHVQNNENSKDIPKPFLMTSINEILLAILHTQTCDVLYQSPKVEDSIQNAIQTKIP